MKILQILFTIFLLFGCTKNTQTIKSIRGIFVCIPFQSNSHNLHFKLKFTSDLNIKQIKAKYDGNDKFDNILRENIEKIARMGTGSYVLNKEFVEGIKPIKSDNGLFGFDPKMVQQILNSRLKEYYFENRQFQLFELDVFESYSITTLVSSN